MRFLRSAPNVNVVRNSNQRAGVTIALLKAAKLSPLLTTIHHSTTDMQQHHTTSNKHNNKATTTAPAFDPRLPSLLCVIFKSNPGGRLMADRDSGAAMRRRQRRLRSWWRHEQQLIAAHGVGLVVPFPDVSVFRTASLGTLTLFLRARCCDTLPTCHATVYGDFWINFLRISA